MRPILASKQLPAKAQRRKESPGSSLRLCGKLLHRIYERCLVFVLSEIYVRLGVALEIMCEEMDDIVAIDGAREEETQEPAKQVHSNHLKLEL